MRSPKSHTCRTNVEKARRTEALLGAARLPTQLGVCRIHQQAFANFIPSPWEGNNANVLGSKGLLVYPEPRRACAALSTTLIAARSPVVKPSQVFPWGTS